MSRMIPVKTNDIVEKNGSLYMVKSVYLSGVPLLTLSPIQSNEFIAHIDEVKLVDSGEAVRRAKSVGLDMLDNNKSVAVPSGMTEEQAKAVLDKMAKALMEK